ncbi:major facilitator superfamily transporter [Coniochaeta sp. 2T2.1]|nr:major facilitator superfamily transporter [Coniochaeta sp. 2T2.1]
MVRPSVASAAAAPATRPRIRTTDSGSFHAGAPIPYLGPYRRASASRRQSTHEYHTFPTPPPKTPNELPNGFLRDESDDSDTSSSHETPLPWKQLCLLAILSLAEQTALNSISPYLPTMVGSFDEIPTAQTGLYVGLLASAFALAQLTTNLIWGYLSDVVGRKPVMLLGTALLGVCFGFFGFCRNYGQLVAVHVAMGLLNGNAAVVPTCLGEVTDRSNQSRAFIWLPVMYSIGGITGPALGGLLVGDIDHDKHPFLKPNCLSAALLGFSVVVLAIWFDETLDNVDKKTFGVSFAWVGRLFRRGRGRQGSLSSRWPTRSQPDATTDDSDSASEEEGLLQRGSSTADNGKDQDEPSAWKQLANRTTLTVLFTYLVFQLSNISYNSLYPIFASAPLPTGRELGPDTIGLSLSFAGLATIIFQLTLFQPLKQKIGNLGTYRIALLGLAISMALMPWVGYIQEKPWLGIGTGKMWLYAELGFILLVKNACAVGGLSSVMLLITNSAPSHEVLGTLNGIAQSLSAAGRSIGPFLSGALFTLSEGVQPKGEALAWGLFAGIALAGWVGTLFIRGHGLESDDWEGDDEETDEEAGGS